MAQLLSQKKRPVRSPASLSRLVAPFREARGDSAGSAPGASGNARDESGVQSRR